MAKIYILEGARGSHDDYRTFIVGVFSTWVKADEAKRRTIDSIKMELAKFPCPLTDEEVKLLDKPAEFRDTFNKSWDESYELYGKWRYGSPVRDLLNYNLKDFNVLEYEMDVNHYDFFDLYDPDEQE